MIQQAGTGAERERVVVIGGGPGGATAAAFLAKKGLAPLLLERERFPRFHIGESLLPASQAVWERLGIAEPLQHSGYTFKFGGRFAVGRSRKDDEALSATGTFSNIPPGYATPRPFAYQVERAVFDKQLLEHATACGARVREASVRRVLFEGERAVGVEVLDADGVTRTIRCELVIDASGRYAVTARQRGLLELDPVVQTSACFAHYHGVSRDDGALQGYFNGYYVEHGWVWFIPLAGDVMSVGLVQNKPACDRWSNDARVELERVLGRHAYMRKRFAKARSSGKARMFRDLAYRSRSFAGPGWLAVGDAAFFIDPLYSSGVHTALLMGEAAAEAAEASLKHGGCVKPLHAYERRFEKYYRFTRGYICSVYKILRSHSAATAYTWVPGVLFNNLDHPLIRPVTRFLNGYFEEHHGFALMARASMEAAAFAAGTLARWTGWGSWERFEAEGGEDSEPLLMGAPARELPAPRRASKRMPVAR